MTRLIAGPNYRRLRRPVCYPRSRCRVDSICGMTAREFRRPSHSVRARISPHSAGRLAPAPGRHNICRCAAFVGVLQKILARRRTRSGRIGQVGVEVACCASCARSLRCETRQKSLCLAKSSVKNTEQVADPPMNKGTTVVS